MDLKVSQGVDPTVCGLRWCGNWIGTLVMAPGWSSCLWEYSFLLGGCQVRKDVWPTSLFPLALEASRVMSSEGYSNSSSLSSLPRNQSPHLPWSQDRRKLLNISGKCSRTVSGSAMDKKRGKRLVAEITATSGVRHLKSQEALNIKKSRRDL